MNRDQIHASSSGKSSSGVVRACTTTQSDHPVGLVRIVGSTFDNHADT
ncbi:hypothetical protein N601_15585 [Rhodococcus erythropolis DN1]|nr:hypothetical protein N601_15585 [Rhodococcus erythropolis DN1]